MTPLVHESTMTQPVAWREPLCEWLKRHENLKPVVITKLRAVGVSELFITDSRMVEAAHQAAKTK